jgi:hypothetical protein
VEADPIFAAGHARAETGLLDDFSKLDVVDHFHGQLPVRAGFFVGSEAHDLERPDAGIAGRFGIVCAPRTRAEQKAGAEGRERDFFAESVKLGLRQERQVIPAFLLREGNGAPQHVGLEVDIRVGEHEPFAGGMLVGLLERMRLSEPARRQPIDAHGLEARILRCRRFEDRAGSILGTVVDGDDFVARIIKRQHGFDGAGHFFGLIATGEENRNAGALRVVERRGVAQPGDGSHASGQIDE